MEPELGHDAGGRGSTNSAGSDGKSEYSLMRSSETWDQGKSGPISLRDNNLKRYHNLFNVDQASELDKY